MRVMRARYARRETGDAGGALGWAKIVIAAASILAPTAPANAQESANVGALSGTLKKIISFVLPMGYSFNLDGSMMYCTFAVLFIAQAYNIELSIGEQITMLLLLMLTSKGMAGVPRASLVVIAATLASFNIPEAGLLLIIGIDQFLDMGRSATNVIGNTLATAAIAKWEGERVDLRELEAAITPKAA